MIQQHFSLKSHLNQAPPASISYSKDPERSFSNYHCCIPHRKYQQVFGVAFKPLEARRSVPNAGFRLAALSNLKFGIAGRTNASTDAAANTLRTGWPECRKFAESMCTEPMNWILRSNLYRKSLESSLRRTCLTFRAMGASNAGNSPHILNPRALYCVHDLLAAIIGV